MKTAPPFHAADVARAFNQAATNYDHFAVIQREIGNRLMQRLDCLNEAPNRILDVGSGTGVFTQALQQRFPDSQVIGLDFAFNMTKIAQQKHGLASYLCADARSLPFKPQCVDLIFSNLTFQWCYPLSQIFQNLAHTLQPAGEIFFATLGPQTLIELRESFHGIDGSSHVSPFYDLITIGNALQAAGFMEPVVDRETITFTYTDVMSLFKDLKGTGSQNKNADRKKGCMSSQQLQRAIAQYEAFKRPDGSYPASYEVIFGHARKPIEQLHRQNEDGIVRIPATHVPILKAHR